MPSQPEHESFRAVPFIGAFVFPGLGHVLGGDRKRGACVAAGVLGLFLGGIFIGGIDAVDSKEDRVWFYGQALVGPLAFGVDYVHQHHFKVIDPVSGQLRSAYPYERRNPETGQAEGTPDQPKTPPNKKSIGKMNEIGTLFATIAGMMNLIAAIDAGLPVRRRAEK